MIYAYRDDLADVALAGRVIASHYAEPLLRHVVEATELRAGRSDEADVITTLRAGDALLMLDCSLGWAWGYAGPDRQVGYVRAGAIKP